jgi:hypothetical protein
MKLNLTELCQVFGEAIAIYMRAAPKRELRLTPHAWMGAAGEPYADFNQVLVDASHDAADQLYTFHLALQSRKLPALYLFTPAVAEQCYAMQSCNLQRSQVT